MNNKILILRILIVIGVAKLVTLLILTFFNDPQNQYNVQPVGKDTTEKSQLLGSGSFAPTDPTLTPPRVSKIEAHANSVTHLYGTGEYGSVVMLYVTQISSPLSADIKQGISIYTTTVSKDGSWKIEDDENDFLLPEGTYNGTVFAYYPELNKKSIVSDSFSFSIKPDTFYKILSIVDTATTALVLLVIFIELILFIIKYKPSFKN